MLLWGFGVLFTVGDALAQGTVNFSTRGAEAPQAPVLLATGRPATGPVYVAMLLAGPVGGPLMPVSAPTPFLTGALAGHVSGGRVTIPNIPPGGPASVQMVAWNSSLYPDWPSAMAHPGGDWGMSEVFSLTRTGDRGTAVPLVGLQSFVIPEPSGIPLGSVGGILLAAWRFRCRWGGESRGA
jgi:hypothetical protein